MLKNCNSIIIFISSLLLPTFVLGVGDVFYGGVAFVGSYEDFNANYPYTYPISLERSGIAETPTLLNEACTTSVLNVYRQLENVNLRVSQLANFKSGDGLVLALAIDGEDSFTYHVGRPELGIDIYKMTADLSAQILVFDYQTKTIVFSYPIFLRLVSAKNGVEPSKADFKEMYRKILFDETSAVNLLSAFQSGLSHVSIDRKESGRIQVRQVTIEGKSNKWLPSFYLDKNSRLQGVLGRNFSKYLTENTGANVLPYLGSSNGLAHEDRNLSNTGAALAGTMAMRFSGGEVFNLVIPEPDYVFDVSLRGFSKTKGKENAGGESWIYGTYINLKVLQPTISKVYLDENLKNVFVSVSVKGFPSSKEEDWSSFNEATMVLFNMVTRNFLERPDRNWAKAYGAGKSTVSSLNRVAKVLEKCK